MTLMNITTQIAINAAKKLLGIKTRGLPTDSIIYLPEYGLIGDLNEQERLIATTGIVRQNQDLFAGKFVLDLASNAGHFPILYSALGASCVFAVEGREVFEKTFMHHLSAKVPPTIYNRISWFTGDVRNFSYADFGFDTVSCLGLLYHLQDGWSTIKRIVDESECKHLLLDTMLWDVEGDAIEHAFQSNKTALKREVVPHPTVDSVERQIREYGWSFTRLAYGDIAQNGTKRGIWRCGITKTEI